MPSIAIVGMACRYPGAATPAELWENALAQRREFRRMPEERMRLEDYFSEDRSAPDRTYARMAAVIEGYRFDRVRFRVSGSAFRSADMTHWLALEVASGALADAGFDSPSGLPRDATGVYVGNTLAGEFSRANVMRLRWPYVRRTVEAALAESALPAADRREFLDALEARYKAPFPGVGEDTLAGGMSNTIAGRIANHYDLHGGAYAVDGACASSLLAVTTACNALESGDVDMAIAGGVDLSLDPFELVGFAKAGALAQGAMRVYDARSSGFWPGEGCGMVVLMRARDAANARQVYATIRGWGVSSDGSGGITRPEVEGQLLALRRAYQRAGYGPGSVSYFEGHGTGTEVGDATELKALSRARREDGFSDPAAIGSIKANIGHTKAAAGVAGLIKAALAARHQTLPPATACERPHPELAGEDAALRILRTAEAWPYNRPVRASVSAMGFGGINAHIALEGAAYEPRPLAPETRAIAGSAQDAELFLFAAADREGLAAQLRRVGAFAARLSFAELADLAAELRRTLKPGPIRAAIVAAAPDELAGRVEGLRSQMATDAARGIFFGDGATAAPPRVGFLFPGQGAPAHLTGGIWRRRLPCVEELYSRAGLPENADGRTTGVAQPAIATASLAALGVLERLGIQAVAAVGHSLGELAALHWAGAFDESALLRIASARGRAMEDLGGPRGAMASVAALPARVEELLNGEPVRIAGLNSPAQTVISGASEAVAAVVERARASGFQATLLPVSHAFHSALVADAEPALAAALEGENVRPPARTVFSTVTGEAIEEGADVRDLLLRQVTSPVRFSAALAAARESVDVWIEAGPGSILSGLAAECSSAPAMALDAGGESLTGLLSVTAALFAAGAPVRLDVPFHRRFTRPFALDWRPVFFASPCESAPAGSAAAAERVADERVADQREPYERSAASSGGNAVEIVRSLVAARAELPVGEIRDDSRLLSHLHLNSIVAGQIVAEAARRIGSPPPLAPTEYADATVAEIASALEQLSRLAPGEDIEPAGRVPPGVDAWFRAFHVELAERPLPQRRAAEPAGAWRVMAAADHPLAERLRAAFANAPGSGVALCLPAAPGLMLAAAQRVLEHRRGARFVVVQHGGGGAPLARTLHLESPEIVCCVVDLPFAMEGAAERVRDEALAAAGYAEAHYDGAGVRREPRLRLLPEDPAGPDSALPLGRDDALLITGGGKGIAAECGLALARATGCRLILLGRSHPQTDAGLAANLERFQAAGVRFHYAAADVTDAAAVRSAVAESERLLGPVTAVLHGAGTNVPRLLPALTGQAFLETLAPKIDGLRNVLAAVDARRLRLLIAFGSLTALVGMRGEADYATANHWLTLAVEAWQAEHPQCRCLALEWSVWSGAGMGQRLGRLDALLRQGITPLPDDEAMRLLEGALRRRGGPVAVALTGRFGDPPTLQLDRPELPFRRFLERTRAYVPGVELIVEAELSCASDPYLTEHVWRGARLLPAVIGLEAMAQAAMALLETAEVPVFERVRFLRPVTVPDAAAVTLRIAALVQGPGCCEVVVRSSETAFQADHFSAVCRVAADAPAPERAGADAAIAEPPLAIDPAADLYGSLLFHGGRFRRLRSYRRLSAAGCVAEIAPRVNVDAWFWPYLPPALALGDAAARDAAIHAIQATIPHAILLPVSVEKVWTAALDGGEPLFVHARERSRAGDVFVYDADIVNAGGALVERWQGLALHRVEAAPSRERWPEPLLAAWLERRAGELLPGAAPAISLGASFSQTGLAWRPDGKPELPDPARAVSRSHSRGRVLTVEGAAPLACDMEPVAARTERAWRDLLGARYALAEELARQQAEPFDMAATRVWTAVECLKKAGWPAGAPLAIERLAPDGAAVLRCGGLAIASMTAAGSAFSILAAGAACHARV